MSTDGSALGYAELLRLATTNGLQELDCNVVQIPNDGNGNHAVVVASARTTKGLFRAIGEARQASLPLTQQDYTLTVAESRAKVSALSEAVGMPRILLVDSVSRTVDTPAEIGQTRQRVEPVQASSARDDVEVQGRKEPDKASSLREIQRVTATHGVRQSIVDAVDRSTSGSSSPSRASEPATQRERLESQQQESRTGKNSPIAPSGEMLGPDVITRLLEMTRRKAEAEGAAVTEEEAMLRLDSFFQRAFGHPVSEGNRVEAQRVVQRLASDLARLSADHSLAKSGRA